MKVQAAFLLQKIKSMLVGSVFEDVAMMPRRIGSFYRRARHPELSDNYLEQPRIRELLARSLKQDSCGVDVGAHIGSFLSLLQQYAPNGQHIAFEPARGRSEQLARKFPKSTIHPHAVSDRSGSFTFEENLIRPGYSRIQPLSVNRDDVAHYPVSSVRLDDAIAGERRVDFIKLDVEGGELAALAGAKATILREKPMILFECGSEYEPGLKRRELYDFITKELSYSVYTLPDYLHDKGPLSFEEFQKCGQYPFRAFNFVAVTSFDRKRSEPV